MTDLSRPAQEGGGRQRRKRPFPWAFALGVGLAMGTPMEGCLVPQSVDPVTTRVHVPPRIPLEKIHPDLLAPVLLAYRQGPTDVLNRCSCTLDLVLPIEDDDTSANLDARWFVDYDVNNRPSTGSQNETTLPGSFDNPIARPPVTFTVQPDSFATNGTHVIELVVAEQGAFLPSSASSTLPNRAVDTAAGFQSVVYRFVIDVEPSPNPSCPGALPSRRVGCQ